MLLCKEVTWKNMIMAKADLSMLRMTPMICQTSHYTTLSLPIVKGIGSNPTKVLLPRSLDTESTLGYQNTVKYLERIKTFHILWSYHL